MTISTQPRLPSRAVHAREIGELLAGAGLRRCEQKLEALRATLRSVEQDLAYGEREGTLDDSALQARRRALKEEIGGLETERSSYVWHPILPQLGQQRPPQEVKPQQPVVVADVVVSRPSEAHHEPFMASSPTVAVSSGRTSTLRTLAWTAGALAVGGAAVWGLLMLRTGSDLAVKTPAARQVELTSPASPAAVLPAPAPTPVTTVRTAFQQKLETLVAEADTLRVTHSVNADAPFRSRLEYLAVDAARIGRTYPEAIGAFNQVIIRMRAMTFVANGHSETGFITPGLLYVPSGANPEAQQTIASYEISALDIALHAALERGYIGVDQVPQAITSLRDSFDAVRSHLDSLRGIGQDNPKVTELLQRFDVVVGRARAATFQRTYRDGTPGTAVIHNLPPPFLTQVPALAPDPDASTRIRNALANTVEAAQALRSGPYTADMPITLALTKIHDRVIVAAKADPALIGEFNAALVQIHAHSYEANFKPEPILTPSSITVPAGIGVDAQRAIVLRELDALRASVRPDLPNPCIDLLVRDFTNVYRQLHNNELRHGDLATAYNALHPVIAQAAAGKVNHLGRPVTLSLPALLD